MTTTDEHLTLSPLQSPGLTDGSLVIDNSTLEHYITCRKSYYYHDILKRTAAAQRSALTWGGAIHEGLAVRYREHDPRTGDLIDPAIANRMKAAFDKSLDDANYVEEAGDHRTRTFGRDVLDAYNGYYIAEPFSVLTFDDVKLVEIPFAEPLGEINGVPVVWSGKMDVATTWNDGIAVKDHKTTSMGGSKFFDEFINSQQMLGYVWAAQKMIGLTIRSYVVNALVCRPPTKTNNLNVDFLRQKFYVEADRVEEWHDNTLVICADLLRDIERNVYPMETKWCVGKYGRCQYLDVCTLPRTNREILLQSAMFTETKWSPLT